MKLHNTLTRTIQDITPLHDHEIKLYTCGLTVYSQPHIGNWTGYIYWDVLVRALKAAGYKVDRTQNITDVGHLVSDDDAGNDKMEVGARREGKTAWDIAEKYSQIADHEAYDVLRLLRPQHIVRATDCIQEQIAFVVELERLGYTYSIPGEGVYFDTTKLPSYGTLARLDIQGLQAGARVSIAGKRSVTDFAVWKFSPAGQQRDMEWDSPWGKGFPGWHLECSVIASETLGDQIDIHAGGVDHIPVHHTNEIAQTEAVTGKPFAQYWIHNNHLKVNGGKMSKSAGTTYTLADITARGHTIDAFKFLVLAKHYRTEGNFTWEILQAAENRLKHWQDIAALRHQSAAFGMDDKSEEASESALTAGQRILTALSNDLDTPGALIAAETVLHAIEQRPAAYRSAITDILQSIDELLGISLLDSTPDITAAQKELIAERQEARERKDWAASDRIRNTLEEDGVGIKDTPAGTIWRRL